MKYVITLESDYLRAELFDHGTVEDTKIFLRAVFWASVEYLRGRVLIHVRSSRPFLSAESDDAFGYIRRIGRYRTNRIALLGDIAESSLRRYLAARAGWQNVNLRCFSDESKALHWLRDRREGYDRRAAPGRVAATVGVGERTLALIRPGDDRRRRAERRRLSAASSSLNY